MPRTTSSYKGLTPASDAQRQIHARASKKNDTRCEQLLRSALWRKGFRFRKNVTDLPGKPDIFFPKERVVVFCDGDFWHGKNWLERKARLQRGTNPDYWITKIETNMARDARHDRELADRDMVVLRYWESDIKASLETIAHEVAEEVVARREGIDQVASGR